MKIKKRVKISFFTIVVLVILLGVSSIFVTDNIKKSAALNNKISNIILLQERMNQAIQSIDSSTSIGQIDSLKEQFDTLEKSFEELRKDIRLDGIISFSNNIQNIEKDLQKLYKNEHSIEISFEQMYLLQEEYIKEKISFNEAYPIENKFRSLIFDTIVKYREFEEIKNFGQARYYSKETLYQKPTIDTLNKWINYIELTKNEVKNKKLIQDLEKYKKIALRIGQNAINIYNIEMKKSKLMKNINLLLIDNKKLASHISTTFTENSEKSANTHYTFLISLISIIIIFIVVFGYIVSQNIGLSVSQIEDKVEEGLKEIKELNKEIEDTQREIVYTMGTIAEHRSKETGNHVKRVANYSKILAIHYGLDEEEAELLKQASPMHDIGKIAIPDAVLNKPGRFNEEERKIMDTHAYLGYQMLKNSNRKLLKAASIVAHEHHEKWDGSGYPRGLAGENIHIYGRITAIADVFDALGSDRVYKKAWDNERIFKLFKDEKGKHFDPKLIDIFFDNLDEFLEIQKAYKDV